MGWSRAYPATPYLADCFIHPFSLSSSHHTLRVLDFLIGRFHLLSADRPEKRSHLPQGPLQKKAWLSLSMVTPLQLLSESKKMNVTTT
jgi:hypothetical protein